MRFCLVRFLAMAAGGLLLAPVAGWTQQQSPETTISVESRLVNIPSVVHDDKGKLILNLRKEDFLLQVDGRPQTIRYFDLDTDLPLTVGLLVDTSASQRDALNEERSASTTFLDNMLSTQEDKAFLIQFARSVELLQDLTNSRPRLQAALKQLDTQPPDRTGVNGGNPNDTDSTARPRQGRRMGFGAGTTLYDAVFLASDEVIARQKGRKALVVLTDGVDRGSKERLTDAIESAQRSDTIVYAIYFKGTEPSSGGGDRRGGFGRRGGIGFPGGYPGGGRGNPGGGRRGQENQVDGRKILERMTTETGGRVFEVSKKDTVSRIFDQIGQELRSQYRIGFTLEDDTAAEGYHKIDLAFTSKDKNKLTIQTRDGYYTGAKPSRGGNAEKSGATSNIPN